MHQLWPHPNGTFYVLYGPRLRRRVSTRTKDRRRAETFLAQFIAGSADPVVESPTVGEILAGYRDEHGPKIRGQDTLRFNVAALSRHLGLLHPEHLTPVTVTRYARQRADEGVGPGTILREVGVLRAAGGWAVLHRWLPAFPEIPNPVKAPRARERWMTREEARRLIAACREPHIRLFVMLGLMTLARTSAILEAKWSQINWERRIIDYGEGHGNKRRAIVPLNDELFAVLKATKELSCSDFIVEYHGEPVRRIKKGFRLACDRAGIAGVTPHVLRHSGASWLVEDGVDENEIARMLGDTVEMVRRVYGHHSPTYLKRASAALQLGERLA